MRTAPISRFCFIALAALMILASHSTARAQESCVFLPKGDLTVTQNDRPIGRVRPLRPLKHLTPLSAIDPVPEFTNINVSHDFTQDQNETSVVVDPADPSRIVIGANDYRSFDVLWSYTSTDGGLHWLNQAMPAHQSQLPQATDPSLALTKNGVVYFAYGVYEPTPQPRSEVLCYKSIDGGRSWASPTIVWADTSVAPSHLADKYYIAVDNDSASPRFGTIYVCWVEIGNGTTRIAEANSTNGGLTWSPRAYVTPDARQYQCPVPATLPNGKLVVTYIDLDSNRQQILAAVSDGGATFGSPIKVSDYRNLGPLVPPNDLEGHPTIKGLLDVNSFPSIAIDHSTRNPKRIYVTWAATDGAGAAHIYLSTSDDEAASWSAPLAIENDPSPKRTDKFFPWVAVDQSNGDVGVCFYDSRDDQDSNLLVNFYLALSTDGGQRFVSRRVSDVGCDPHLGFNFVGSLNFFGDYTGLAAAQGYWYPAWTDTRSGYDQDVYTALVHPHAPAGVLALAVTETATQLAALTWNYSGLTSFGWPLAGYHFRLRRTDGAIDRTLSAAMTAFTDSTVLPGLDYTYTVQAIGDNGDSSISRSVLYSPEGSHTPEAPIITDAAALTDGIDVTTRIPDKNQLGQPIQGLQRLYFAVDGSPFDSLDLTDAMRGTLRVRSLRPLSSGYHKVQVSASALGVTSVERSAITPAAYLYAGDAATQYASDWTHGPLFTAAHWDTTTANGRFSTPVLNDSLPDVPYVAGTNSWSLLPPIAISPTANTIELESIALVADQDSALIEVSSNDGLSFTSVGALQRASHPAQWKQDLASSDTAHDAYALKSLNGKSAVIRLRLSTHTADGDGWFIASVRTSDLMVVPEVTPYSQILRTAYPDPARVGGEVRFEFSLSKSAEVSARLVDALGITRATVIPSERYRAGSYELSVRAGSAGVYWLVLDAATDAGNERHVSRLVVLP